MGRHLLRPCQTGSHQKQLPSAGAGDECARTWWGVSDPPVPASVLACLEWDFGSGGLKKESGSFLILMGTEGGTMVFFGFITALKSASRSVSESPRTWTIWCPAGGLCWLGSIVPKQSFKLSVSKNAAVRNSQKKKFDPIPNFFFFFFHAAGNLEISTAVSKSYPGSF